MYSNIPTRDLTTILNDLRIKNNVDDKTKKEILKIAQTVINQNYFQFQDNIYLQKEGLAMGAPTSSILSEINLQHMKGTTIPKLLRKHNIRGYFRYVDDILLVYIDNITNIHMVLNEFNNLTPKLKFTLEEQQNNQINFLDFTIIKNHKGLILLLLLLLLLTLQPWVGLGLFNNSIPLLFILNLCPPTNNFHPL